MLLVAHYRRDRVDEQIVASDSALHAKVIRPWESLAVAAGIGLVTGCGNSEKEDARKPADAAAVANMDCETRNPGRLKVAREDAGEVVEESEVDAGRTEVAQGGQHYC